MLFDLSRHLLGLSHINSVALIYTDFTTRLLKLQESFLLYFWSNVLINLLSEQMQPGSLQICGHSLSQFCTCVIFLLLVIHAESWTFSSPAYMSLEMKAVVF